MEGFEASTYGDRWAVGYDEWVDERLGTDATDAAVGALTELAGPGPVLEFAIGSGRLAVPLAARDIEVHGIEVSAAMVEQLRAKPGADAIRVIMGDMAAVEVGGRYPLIYLAYSTLFALTSQDQQLRCFRNAARHLLPGGRFVVEAFVPDPSRFRLGGATLVRSVGLDSVRLEASQHDPVGQRITSQHVVISEHGTELLPMHLRYAWPPELDLMGQLAGLRLEQRWGDWHRSPFTATSTNHVSVYTSPSDPVES